MEDVDFAWRGIYTILWGILPLDQKSLILCNTCLSMDVVAPFCTQHMFLETLRGSLEPPMNARQLIHLMTSLVGYVTPYVEVFFFLFSLLISLTCLCELLDEQDLIYKIHRLHWVTYWSSARRIGSLILLVVLSTLYWCFQCSHRSVTDSQSCHFL